MNAQTLRDAGILIEQRPDGIYLAARFECDECGPFDNESQAIAYAPTFRPCLEDTE